MTNTAEHEPVLHATEARQGRRGRHVLWILVVSLVLVVAALFGTWWAKSGDLADANANNGATATAIAPAQTFNAPEPAPRQTDVQTPPGGVIGGATPDPVGTQTR
jgi:hypothetical protein